MMDERRRSSGTARAGSYPDGIGASLCQSAGGRGQTLESLTRPARADGPSGLQLQLAARGVKASEVHVAAGMHVDGPYPRGSGTARSRPRAMLLSARVIVSNDGADTTAERLGRGVVRVVPVDLNTARVHPPSKSSSTQQRQGSSVTRRPRRSRSDRSPLSESVAYWESFLQGSCALSTRPSGSTSP